MQLPYVSSPALALSAAQVSTAIVLTVLVWSRPLQSALGSVLLVIGIWVAALAPTELRWLAASGLPHSKRLDWLLGVSSMLFVMAALLQRRRSVRAEEGDHRLEVAAVIGACMVHVVGQYVAGSDNERTVLQVILGALIYALARPRSAPVAAASRRSFVWAEAA